MKVADYVFKHLADYGVDHVFLVTGGGAMYLNDALRNETRIAYVCNHHEQACAIAAEGYSRTSGKLAVVSVTSGPGGTNALTGLLGQWTDSVPVLYISGQVKTETTCGSCPNVPLRQLGDQEANIIDIVRPITKYAKMVTDPAMIRAELERAIYIATSGRPGPVWLDIPLDVQGASVDAEHLQSSCIERANLVAKDDEICAVFEALQKAERPLFIAGHGIRISGAKDQFLDLVRAMRIPVVTTFNGFDLMPSSSDYFVGRIGSLGSRAGNFALQTADLVVCLGTRNNIRQVSYNWSSFAKNAKKIIVDIDYAELRKKTVKGDLLIHADVGDVIVKLLKRRPKDFRVDKDWLIWCQHLKRSYPVVLDEYRHPTEGGIHPYHFIKQLTNMLDEGVVVVAGNGTACVGYFHAGIVKPNQRVFWNSGCAAMGYDLPAAIGAACAARRVVCITGDGSIQMNIQELQTIRYYKWPIKIFLLNNQGYHSIKMTQSGFFEGNLIGCHRDSGVSFPDNARLAELYGLEYFQINSTVRMQRVISSVLAYERSVLCEVVLNCDYTFAPRLASSRDADGRLVSSPLEDLSPPLSRYELNAMMSVSR